MKKIDAGQAIGILANIGVIAGIVFLAFELQQNNELLGAQARAVRIGIRTDYAGALYSDPGLVQAMVKAENGEPLSAEDIHRIRWFGIQTLDKFEYVYGEYQRGMIEAEALAPEAWRNTFEEDIPGLVEIWDQERHQYGEAFVEYIDSLISDL